MPEPVGKQQSEADLPLFSPPESGDASDKPEEAGPSDAETLCVSVAGFSGPLDLLLTLARRQKVDVTKIAILDLATQYLAFISAARRLRLDLAADYLVMAAWLAYLKSRLLLPEDAEEDADEALSGEAMAAQLAFRLKRLAAMREAAAALMQRPQLGRDVFARPNAEGICVKRVSRYDANVYDLLKAYARQRQRTAVTAVRVKARPVWTIKQARRQLAHLLGELTDWAPLDQYLTHYLTPVEGSPVDRRSLLASSFGASLEMAREGLVEMRQAEPFAPLFLRPRAGKALAIGKREGEP